VSAARLKPVQKAANIWKYPTPACNIAITLLYIYARYFRYKKSIYFCNIKSREFYQTSIIKKCTYNSSKLLTKDVLILSNKKIDVHYHVINFNNNYLNIIRVQLYLPLFKLKIDAAAERFLMSKKEYLLGNPSNNPVLRAVRILV